MADYSGASTAANEALSTAHIKRWKLDEAEVERPGNPVDSAKHAFLMEGMAARRAAGGFGRLAKFQGASE